MIAWRPVPLHFPVALEESEGDVWSVPPALRSLAPAAPGAAIDLRLPRIEGPVVVGPRRAALVRVTSLALLRVRVEAEGRGPAPRPDLRRITGEPGAGFSAIAEPGVEVSPGTWLIEQPPGGPGFWLVRAARPVRVWIEAAELRVGDLIWEHASAAVLAWIAEGGPLPPLPEVPGAEALRQSLLADAEVAAELRRREPDDPGLHAAAAAWRAAAALQHLAVERDLQRAAFALEAGPRGLERTDELVPGGGQDLPWRRRRGPGAWDLRLEGPGILSVSARLVGPGLPGRLEVVSEGRRLARAALAPERAEEPGPGLGDLTPGTGPLSQSPRDPPPAAPVTPTPEPAASPPRGRDYAGPEAPAPAALSPPRRGLARGPGALSAPAPSVSPGRSAPAPAPQDTSACAAPPPATPPRQLSTGAGAGDELLAGPLAAPGDEDLAARLGQQLGAPVGPRGELRVALAPGWHTYTLRITGHDAVLQVRSARDNERLAAALRGEHVSAAIRRARRALARTGSPRAPLLAALLDALEGLPPRRPLPAGDSPTLNLAQSLLTAQRADLTDATRVDLARTLARRASQIDPGPLAWRARAAGLELIEDLREPALARALAGPRPAEAPAAVLRRVAQQIEGPPLALRSPAIALLERARRLRPLDLSLRTVYRERWRSGTRWAALRADEAAGDPWTWIEPLPAGSDRSPTTSSLWTLPPGQLLAVRAAAAGYAPGRAALLRLYVHAAPAAAIGLRVGHERWHTRALRPLEQLRVAMPPGPHSLQVHAPQGTRLWSSLPPEPARPPDARLLRMWPLAPGQALQFVLPSGRAPAFARVELRVIAAQLPARVRVTVGTDAGPAREVEVDLGAEDTGVLPVDAPEGAGRRATLVVPIEAEARALRVTLAPGAPKVAVSASIRATRAPPATAPDRHASSDMSSDRSAAGPEGHDLTAMSSAPPRAGMSTAADGHDLTATSSPPPRAGMTTEDAALAEVAALTRALQAAPDDPALRLRRAGALLDLGQIGLAFVDWRRLVAHGLPHRLQPDALEFAARLEAYDAPSHVDVTASAPVLVQPALAAVVGDDPDRLGPLAPAIAAAWASGPDAGLAALDAAGHVLPDMSSQSPVPGASFDPAAAALRAGWLDAAGRPEQAAALWSRVAARAGAWQADLAAAHSYLAALDGDTPAADGAGLAYGLSLALARTIRTPALRRLQTLAAARSRWSRVSGSEQDAGVEGLEVPRASALPSPSAAVREALLAPPWPHADATLLRPGYATVLALRRDDPGALAIDLWCQSLRPDLADGAPPRVRVRLDGADLRDGQVPEDMSHAILTGPLAPGRHRVEVELDGASRAHLCSARLRDAAAEAGALGSRRPTRWWLARPRRPLEVVVLGPTTVAIEARADLRSGAQRAAIAVAAGDGPFAARETLALPQAADPSAAPERTRALEPGLTAIRVLTLPDPGPHRIRVVPDRGAALVRLQQRVDGSDAAPVPRPPVRTIDLGDLVDEVGAVGLPPLLAPRGAPAPAPVQRFGTTTGELRFGTDDLEDSDDLQPRLTGVVRLGYARELLARRLWLEVQPELRPREDTALTGGGGLALQGVLPRLGLRMRLSGLALAQAHAGGHAWSLRGALRVDRPTWIAPRLQLLPRLDLLGRGQSLAGGDPDPLEPVHPRIFQRYVADHPFVLRPGLDLRFQPWQDARVITGLELAPNSDLRGLDYVSAQAGIYGVLALASRIVPEFWLEEELSLRLRDADRPTTYLRNRLRAGLGLGVWAGRSARVVAGVSDTLYAAAPFPLRNVLELWLRVDLVLGRGLRDFGPLDMAFRSVREHRLWHPRGGPP